MGGSVKSVVLLRVGSIPSFPTISFLYLFFKNKYGSKCLNLLVFRRAYRAHSLFRRKRKNGVLSVPFYSLFFSVKKNQLNVRTWFLIILLIKLSTYSGVIQQVESQTVNLEVGGSSPLTRAKRRY